MSINIDVVLEHVDDLIKNSKIDEATCKLLEFIGNDPYTKSPVKLMNRFILLIHCDIFNYERECNRDLRIRLFKRFHQKSYQELNELSFIKSLSINEMDINGNNSQNYLQIKNIDKHQNNNLFENSCILSYILFKDGKKEVAVNIIEYIIKKRPDNYLAYWLRAVLYQYFNYDFHKTKMFYEKAIELCPDFSYSYYSFAVAYCEFNIEGFHSLKLYNKAIEIDPKHIYAHINKFWYCKKNKIPLNLEIDCNNIPVIFSNLIKIHPTEICLYLDNVRYILQLINVKNRKHMFIAARDLLLDAIKNVPKPDCRKAYYELALLYWKYTPKEYNITIKLLEKYIELSSNHHEIIIIVATINRIYSEVNSKY